MGRNRHLDEYARIRGAIIYNYSSLGEFKKMYRANASHRVNKSRRDKVKQKSMMKGTYEGHKQQ